MTENYPPAPPRTASEPLAPQPQEDQPGTADAVKDQAADLRQSGVEAGHHTASVAQDQVSQVAAELTRHGRGLLAQAQQRLGDQVAHGQQRLAAALLSLGDELSSMADNSRLAAGRLTQGLKSAQNGRDGWVASTPRNGGRPTDAWSAATGSSSLGELGTLGDQQGDGGSQ